MSETDTDIKKRDRRAKVIGLVGYAVSRFIGLTLRIKYKNIERVDEIVKANNGGILVTWHGRTLIPANVFKGRGFWALISLSKDGEAQNYVFRRYGYQTIRGSTGRGGVKAALMLAKKVNEGGVLAFTPDGPRGPTHKVQEGTIFFAQRSGRPIIPLGLSANPRKLLKSWDSYMIPRPFAKAAFVVGDPIFVSPTATDEEKTAIAIQLEAALNACEREAENMVGLTA